MIDLVIEQDVQLPFLPLHPICYLLINQYFVLCSVSFSSGLFDYLVKFIVFLKNLLQYDLRGSVCAQAERIVRGQVCLLILVARGYELRGLLLV